MRPTYLALAVAALTWAVGCGAKDGPESNESPSRSSKARVKAESSPTFTATETTTATATSTATATGTQVVTLTQTTTNTVVETGSSTASATLTLTDTSTVTAAQTETVGQTSTQTATATGTRTVSAPGTYQQIYTLTGTITATGTVIAYYTSWPHSKGNTATTTAMSYSHGTGIITVTRTVTSTVNGTETKTATGTVTGSGLRTGVTTVTVTATVTSSVTNAGTGSQTVTETGTGSGTASQTWTATWTRQLTQTVTDTITSAVTAIGTTTRTVTITSTFTQTQTQTQTLTNSSIGTSSSTGTVTGIGTGTVTTTNTTTDTVTRTVTLTRTDTSTSTGAACGARANAITTTFGNVTLVLNSGAVVDSYRSSDGAYGGSNIGSEGNVVAAGTITNNGGTIKGQQSPNTPSSLPIPSIPSSAINLPIGAPTPGSVNINQAAESVTLAPGAYVVQNLNVNYPGALNISPVGRVTIFVTGSLNLGGNENSNGTPAHLTFVVTKPGWVNVNSGGGLWGNIYAPTAGINLNSAVYGYVVGSSVTLNSGSAVHYDVALRSPCDVPVPQLTCVMPRGSSDVWTAVFGYTNPEERGMSVPADDSRNWARETVGGSSSYRVPEWFLAGGDPAALVAKSSAGAEVTWSLAGQAVTAREASLPECEVVSTPSGTGIVVDGIVRRIFKDPVKIDRDSTLPAESDGAASAPHAQGHPEGVAAATHDGEAVYDVPLWTPPGRAGLQPALALHYGSRAGNGMVGRGFSITGFSRINRCGRDVARDGKAAPIKWNSSDYFCLDGQRLIPVSGANGGEGTRYKTEIDTYVRVTSLNVDSLGPRNFTVEKKDGRKLWYGYSTGRVEGKHDVPVPEGGGPVLVDARYGWALDRIEDRFGNYMTIDYASATIDGASRHLPSKVSYTGHPSALPNRVVEFQYADLPPNYGVRKTYIAGMAFDQTKLLADVRVKVDGATVRHYHFEYLMGHHIPELHALTEGDGVTTRDPITFNWLEDPEANFYTVSMGDITDITANIPSGGRILRAADIDGDGLDDLVYRKMNPDTPEHRWDWYVRRSKGLDGFGDPERLPIDPLGTFDLAPDIRLADMNGDGKADVAVRQPSSNLIDPNAPVDCTAPGGQTYVTFGSSCGQCLKTTEGQRWPRHWRWFSNNYPSGFQEGAVEALTAQDGELQLYQCTSLSALENNAITLGDFNGDGQFDVLRQVVHRRYNYFEHGVLLPGQETAELCHTGGETRWGIRQNTGGLLGGYQLLATVGEANLFIPQPGGWGGPPATTYTSSSPGEPRPGAEPYLVDIDGSGRTAILIPKMLPYDDLANGYHYAGYHLGSQQPAVPQPTDVSFTYSEETPLSLPFKASGLQSPNNRYVFADMNGDGLPDAIAYSVDGGQLSLLGNLGGHFGTWSARSTLDAASAYRVASSETFYKLSILFGMYQMSGWQFVSHAAIPGDFTGDGLADLLLLDSGCIGGSVSRNHAVLYESNGNTLVPKQLPIPIGDGASAAGVECPSYRTSVVLDADGDGMPDIAQIENGKLRVYFNWTQPRAVKSILAGKLRTTEFTYVPYRWKASEVEAPSTMPSYPQAGARSGVWVASQIRLRPCPTCSPDRLQLHSYRDGRRDLQLRQFLGFARHGVSDLDLGRRTEYSLGNHTVWTTSSEADPAVTKRLYPFRGTALDKRTEITLSAANSSILASETTINWPIANVSSPGVCPGVLPKKVINAKTYENVPMLDLALVFANEPPYAFQSGFPFTHLAVSTFYYDQYHNVTRRDVTSGWKLQDSSGTPLDPDAPDLSPGPGVPAVATPLETETVITQFDYDEQSWLVQKPRHQVRYGSGIDGRTGHRGTDYVTNPTTGVVTDVIDVPEDLAHTLSEHIERNQFGLVSSVTQTGNANLTSNGQWKSQTRKTTYEYEYSPPYAPSAVINALGQELQLVHSPVTNHLILSIDPDQRTTHYRYDTYGRLRAIDREGDDDNVSYSYPKADAEFVTKTIVTTGAGSRHEIYYDVYGREIQMRSSALNSSGAAETTVVDVGYDILKRQVWRSAPYSLSGGSAEATVTDTFDEDGRLRSETLAHAPGAPGTPAVGPTTYLYSSNSIAATDGAGRTILSTVDSSGRHRVSAMQDQGTTAYSRQYYTFFGLPAGSKDDGGNRILISYYPHGLVDSIEDPDSGKTTLTTNAFGEVIKEDHEGLEVRLEVDLLGRVTRKLEDDVESTTIVWDAPNASGRLWKTATKEGVWTERGYDTLGRLASATWWVGNDKFDVGISFDSAGRLRNLTYPAATDGSRLRLDYEYSLLPDRGAQLTGVLRAGSYVWKLNGLDAAGRVSSFSYGNGTTTERSFYKGTGLLEDTKVSLALGGGAQVVRQDHYLYDLGGNVVTAQNQVSPTEGASYSYDGIGRLMTWTDTSSGAKKRYEYDTIGNLRWIRAVAGGGQDLELKYEGASKTGGPHAVTSIGDFGEFQYNARGQRVAGLERTFTYNTFGLPSGTTGGGVTTSYSYDANGARVVRQASDGSSTISIGGLFERRTHGSVTSDVHYIVADGERIGQLSSNPEAILYFHKDRLNSTIGTTDALGRQAWWHRDPWGRLLSGPAGDVRVGFTGHMDDLDTGLIDMGGRIYDPETTRFLTPDPIPWSSGSGAGNRYAYVRNDPTNLVDPSGFFETEPGYIPSHPGETCGPGSCSYPSDTAAVGLESYFGLRQGVVTIDFGDSNMSSGGGGGSPMVCSALQGIDQTGAVSVSTAAQMVGTEAWRSVPFSQREDLGPPGGLWGGARTGLAGPGVVMDSRKGWKDSSDTSGFSRTIAEIGIFIATAGIGGPGSAATRAPSLATRGGGPDIVYRATRLGPTGPAGPNVAKTAGEHLLGGAERLAGSPFESWTANREVAEAFARARGTTVVELDLRTASSRIAADLRTEAGRAAAAAGESDPFLKGLIGASKNDAEVILRR